MQISSLKLLPPAQQEVLKEMERKLVAIVSDAIAAAIPHVAKKRQLLKPLTMSLFGMLNWHYLWFRDGKGITREKYARMVTGLILVRRRRGDGGGGRARRDVEGGAAGGEKENARDLNIRSSCPGTSSS